jgi:hypothetical protein
MFDQIDNRAPEFWILDAQKGFRERRLAPMRLVPFSYFCICWKVRPYQSPFRGRRRADCPTTPSGRRHMSIAFRGARSEIFPVQSPTRFELVINLKTAKALSVRLESSGIDRISCDSKEAA